MKHNYTNTIKYFLCHILPFSRVNMNLVNNMLLLPMQIPHSISHLGQYILNMVLYKSCFINAVGIITSKIQYIFFFYRNTQKYHYYGITGVSWGCWFTFIYLLNVYRKLNNKRILMFYLHVCIDSKNQMSKDNIIFTISSMGKYI